MCCFLVTVGEAIVTSIATPVVKAREKETISLDGKSGNAVIKPNTEIKIPFSRKLKWLTNLLWGGSFLLAFEHIWHGEVVPWFPFLTAASNPKDTIIMLREMSTVGVAMMVVVTVVWLGMVLVSDKMEKNFIDQRTVVIKGEMS